MGAGAGVCRCLCGVLGHHSHPVCPGVCCDSILTAWSGGIVPLHKFKPGKSIMRVGKH